MSANEFFDDMIVGEAHYHSFDLSSTALELGQAVDSAVWTNSDDTVIQLTNQAVTNSEPRALATALSPGFATLHCLASIGDQKILGTVHIKVSAAETA